MLWSLVITGLGIWAMIGQAEAQMGKTGHCPTLPEMNNFDPSKFAGVWYVIGNNKNSLYAPGHKCAYWKWVSDGDEMKNLEYHSIVDMSGASFDWKGKTTPIDGKSSGNFDVEFPKQAVHRETNFQILTTDYDHYAVQYACQNYGDANLQYFWILSKTPTLAPQYQTAAENYIRENLDFPASSIVEADQEDCPTS